MFRLLLFILPEYKVLVFALRGLLVKQLSSLTVVRNYFTVQRPWLVIVQRLFERVHIRSPCDNHHLQAALRFQENRAYLFNLAFCDPHWNVWHCPHDNASFFWLKSKKSCFSWSSSVLNEQITKIFFCSLSFFEFLLFELQLFWQLK